MSNSQTHTSHTELYAPKYITFKYLLTEVGKWYDEKHEFSALLRLLDKKQHQSLDTPVHRFGLSLSVIDYNTTDLKYSEIYPYSFLHVPII